MNETSNLPALVQVEAGNEVQAIIPTDLDQLNRYANIIYKSGLAPDAMNDPFKIAVAILHGLEIGLKPMQAIQRIAVINGRPTLWGDAALALVYKSGLLTNIQEYQEDTKAICEVSRKGMEQPVIRTFSEDDAKTAGLLDRRGPWQQYRNRMLQMRARAFALRDAFPDVLGGLYFREEMEDGVAENKPKNNFIEQTRGNAPEPPQDTDWEVFKEKWIGAVHECKTISELAKIDEWWTKDTKRIKNVPRDVYEAVQKELRILESQLSP